MKPQFKLYQLVWVIVRNQHTESGKYMHAGEVLSLPTPDSTVMVRRVPGHPGTLEEVKLADLMAMTGGPKHKYIHYAIVQGHGQFPTDMLRYDQCAPVNFKLVPDRWGTLTATEFLPGFEGERDLMVAKTSSRRGAQPWCVERWQSFLWSCKEVRVEQIGEAS